MTTLNVSSFQWETNCDLRIRASSWYACLNNIFPEPIVQSSSHVSIVVFIIVGIAILSTVGSAGVGICLCIMHRRRRCAKNTQMPHVSFQPVPQDSSNMSVELSSFVPQNTQRPQPSFVYPFQPNYYPQIQTPMPNATFSPQTVPTHPQVISDEEFARNLQAQLNKE